MRVLIGGLVGAVISAVAWIAIEAGLDGKELFWFPAIVGLLTGIGVRVAATPAPKGAYLRGAFAAILALITVVGALTAKAHWMQAQTEMGKPLMTAGAGNEAAEEGDAEATGGEAATEVEEAPPSMLTDAGAAPGEVNSLANRGPDAKTGAAIVICGILAYFIGKGPEGLDAVAEEASQAEQEAAAEAEQAEAAPEEQPKEGE